LVKPFPKRFGKGLNKYFPYLLSKMLIKIDYREKDLFDKMLLLNKKENITLLSENLPLGDIIICDNQGVEKIIIERKTLKDLAASIRDGRYKEQSFRLNECTMPNHNIFYLLEGNLQTYRAFPGSVDKYALLSSMTSISYYKGFSLYKANSLDESAEWILQFAFKLDKEGGNGYYDTITNTNTTDTVTDTEDKYISVLKRTKKNNITPENIGEIMLSQIPNVSTTVACAIMEKYKTLKNLIEALTLERTALNTLTTLNKDNKPRKINKTSIDNIYTYLMK